MNVNLSLKRMALVFVFSFAFHACSKGEAKTKLNLIVKDAPRAGVLAKIDGQEITEENLISGELKMEYIDVKKKEYEILMEGLNRAIVDRLVGAEAKKANLSTEEYIDKKIIAGKVKVNEADIKKFATERRFPEAQITPEIKGKISEFLESQKKKDILNAYAANLTKKSPVEVYFKRHKMKVDVEVGESPAWGKASAPVTLIEFSDFQCPFCSQGAAILTELKKKYGESKIRVAFKHLPLPMHPNARPASEASMCINEQSSDKFWKYHDLVFKNQELLNDPSKEKSLGANATLDGLLAKFAKDVGVDMKKFEECYTSKKYAEFVAKDEALAQKLGVRSTPTFFVNGQIVSGALPVAEFSKLIDDELDQTKE